MNTGSHRFLQGILSLQASLQASLLLTLVHRLSLNMMMMSTGGQGCCCCGLQLGMCKSAGIIAPSSPPSTSAQFLHLPSTCTVPGLCSMSELGPALDALSPTLPSRCASPLLALCMHLRRCACVVASPAVITVPGSSPQWWLLHLWQKQ